MRGRLPETSVPTSLLQDLTTIPTYNSISNEEETALQDHISEIEEEARHCLALSESAPKVVPYTLTKREGIALLGIARMVQQDMRVLQAGLSRAGRPPDQRDGDYTPAPDWDEGFLAELIEQWNQPVLLEADYYLLRSMSLYELGSSIQVKVLGPNRVKRYMDMALNLAQRGYEVLRSVLEQDETSVYKYWRYMATISYIQQFQAKMTIAQIEGYEKVVGLSAPDLLYEKARQQVSQALRSFDRGIKHYPSISQSSVEPFKDHWSKMADLTASYTVLANDYLTRQIWTQHTIRLLKGALHENKSKRDKIFDRLSKIHLQFALWIYEQSEKPLLLFPKVSPMFYEMQRAAVAALVYTKYTIESIREEHWRPEHYSKAIDSLHMMSVVCVAPRLIHLYSRRAAHWIDQLVATFPHHRVRPSYLHSARLMVSKDSVMQEIVQHRQAQKQ